MMSDRLSNLSTMLHTNMRTQISSETTSTVTSRPGLGRVPATTLPQAIQMMRNVQTALDWVLNKQVTYSLLSSSVIYH